MATATKKNPQDLSVEEKLKTLYQLQTILSKVDEIKILRGELPLEVKDLEDEVEGLNTRINRIEEEIAGLRQEHTGRAAEAAAAQASIEKYSQQQDNVSNNREYDLLTKEIEFQNLNVQLANKKMREATEAIQAREEDLERARQELAERQNDLEAKKAELEDIVSETRVEEEKLREKAKALETKIEERLLSRFKRIRKNTHNGLGIVCVQREACGGCFNHIPPQRQLDIRTHKKIIVCEYCGRIMIDPELAGVKVEPKEEPKERPSRRRSQAADKNPLDD